MAHVIGALALGTMFFFYVFVKIGADHFNKSSFA
jgi:hypothetical protein